MTPITAYRTPDGKLFESKEQAQDHELGQLLTERLDEFSKSDGCPYPDGVANSQMRKSIIAWERAKQKLESVGFVKDLGLTVRTVNCLLAENIFTISDLLSWTKYALLKTPNIGRKSLNEIIEALKQRDLGLADIP